MNQVDPDTELVITPESYMDEYLTHYKGQYFQYLREWAKTHQAAILLSGYNLTHGLGENGFYHFISIFVSHRELLEKLPNRNDWWEDDKKRIYNKRDLIPFTEFLPRWSRSIGMSSWLRMGNGEMGKREKIIWQVKPNFRIATSICYELYFGQNIRTNAIGADLIVNQGYQSWFAGSNGPELLQKIAKMRALEAGRPVLRVDAYGISSLINPKGQVLFTLPTASYQFRQLNINGYQGYTPYYRFAELPVIIFIVLLWLLAFLLHPEAIFGWLRRPFDKIDA